MELLLDFNFIIIYTASKNNQKANILSRREQDVAAHEIVKRDSRSRTLLSPGHLHHRINAKLANKYMETVVKCILSPIGPFPNDSDLIWDLKVDNLESFKETCEKLPLKYIIDKDNLLLYKGKLYV
jgi:hypothetical protein